MEGAKGLHQQQPAGGSFVQTAEPGGCASHTFASQDVAHVCDSQPQRAHADVR